MHSELVCVGGGRGVMWEWVGAQGMGEGQGDVGEEGYCVESLGGKGLLSVLCQQQ